MKPLVSRVVFCAALHSDIHSPYLRGIEEIQEEIGSGAFKPDALVLGAFQMMDG